MGLFDLFKKKPKSAWDALQENPIFQQNKELFEIMGHMSEDGVDADMLLGGHGEFGLTSTNPIPCKTILGSASYLDRLRANDGSKIVYERVGSTFSDASPHPIDVYEVTREAGGGLATLFISPYHKRNSELAPRGFLIDGFKQVDASLHAVQTRWLRFPEDKSVGTVGVGNGLEGDEFEAVGSVAVPMGMFATLKIHDDIEDLSFLQNCDPTALVALSLYEHSIADDGWRYLRYLTGLTELSLRFTNINDSSFRFIERLTALTHLNLSYTDITDTALQYIGRLAGLQQLDLSGTSVSDTGLRHLGSLVHIESLTLSRTNVTDAGMRHLKNLTALEVLDLSETGITDGGLPYFTLMTQLTELELSSTGITDSGLVLIKHLGNLRKLKLNETKITDAGLIHISALAKLTHLGLSSTNITDSGPCHLERLTELVFLSLSYTRVSEACKAKVRQMLPDCRVY